jgi:hypothetical protein
MSIDIEAERKLFEPALKKLCAPLSTPDLRRCADGVYGSTWTQTNFDVWLERAALAAPQQEPVALRWPGPYGHYLYCSTHDTVPTERLDAAEQLFTAAPPAAPVLSDEEREEIALRSEFWDKHFGFENFYWLPFARALLAKVENK